MPTAYLFSPDAEADPVVVPVNCRVNGVVDLTKPDRIGGWAIDRADPDAAVTVEVFREGARIGAVTANRHRPDLLRQGLGTGNYGYRFDLTAPMDPALAFTITAEAVTADGHRGALRQIGSAAQPQNDPELALLRAIHAGLAALRTEVVGAPEATGADDAESTTAFAARLDRIEQALDRMEIVQARLEERCALKINPATEDRTGPGLVWMVSGALAVGVAALALGLYSVLLG